MEEKFAYSIIHFNQFNDHSMSVNAESKIFKKWHEQ